MVLMTESTTSSRCTGAVALLFALAVLSFETGHVAAVSSLPSTPVQATQSHPSKLRAKEGKRRLQEDEDEEEEEDGQDENNADGYTGYDGFEGYNSYNGSDTLTFSGTGFGSKWNEFFGSMKTWGSNFKNHSSSLSDDSTSSQDSSYAGNSSDYGGRYQGSGYGHYTNDSWNSGTEDYSSTINWEDYQGMQNGDVGFGMTNYDFMYTGCSNVALGSQDGQRQFMRYATFRLCPASTCSDNTFRGCNQNYGEYVVRMDEFLAAMVGFNDERMTGFCEYCQECADIEAFNLFLATISGNKKAALTRAQNHYNDWYQYHYSGNSNSNSAQTKYFKMIHSSSGSSSSSQSVDGYGSDNADAWQSMQQGAGTWYGRPIVNGFYDGYGQFNAAWGYVSAYGGSFVNLEDASITWDPTIYGQLSTSWDEDWLEGGEMLEQCKSSYMEGCREEYESCLEFLTDEEDYEIYQTSSLKKYLECSAVDMDAYAYAKQRKQQYEKNVREQQQGYYEEEVECDDGDEDCAQGQQAEEESEYDQLYIGPHCGGDTLGISLAVYTDENCSSYHGELTVEEVLGTSVNEAEINFFPQQCLSCEAEVWYEGEEVEGADNGINPLCSILYERAGKCNRNMDTTDVYNFASAASDGQYQEQNEEENESEQEEYADQAQFGSEQEACHIIDSLSPKHPDELSRGILIGLIFIAAAAVLMTGLACRLRRKVTEKATERSSSGAVWYPSKSGVSAIALLSKPFSEWTPSKSIAPTSDVRTSRKSDAPANDWSPSNYVSPMYDVSTPRKSAVPTNAWASGKDIAPTNDVSTSRTQAARDESGVIGFGFSAKSRRPLVVPSLGRVPFVPGKIELTNKETKIESTNKETIVVHRLPREPLMPGGCDTLGRAALPDKNQITGHVESASEKIDRLEAEMLRYAAEETSSSISNLSSSRSRNLESNSNEAQEA